MITSLLAFLVLNIIVFYPLYLLPRKKANFSVLESMVASFVMGISEIIVVCLFLGVVLKRLFGLELSLSIIVTSLCITLFFFRKDLKQVIPQIHSIKLPKIKLSLKNILLAVGIIIAVIFIFNLLVLIILHPTTSWDDYNYHLGFVGDIIKTGKLRYFDYTHVYAVSYPHNIELLNYWFITFLKNDFLLELVNFFFYINIIAVIYLVSRKITINKSISAFNSLLVLAVPMFNILVKTTKVDIAVWSLFLTAMYFILKIDLTKTIKTNLFSIVLISLCLGTIAGAKTSGFVFIGVLGSISGIYFFIKFGLENKKVWEMLFAILSISILSIGILGSYWYIRSWVYFDNPIYPLYLELGPVKFEGPWKELDFKNDLPQLKDKSYPFLLHYIWTERENWGDVYYLSDGKFTGTGPWWLIIGLPATIVGLIYALYKKNKEILYLGTTIILSFLLSPGNWVPHYGAFITLAGIIFTGYLLSTLFKGKRIVSGLVISGSITLVLWNLVLTFNGSFFPLELSYKKIFESSHYYFATTNKATGINIYINNNMQKGDKVIVGYACYFPYALYNKDFSNDVIYLPLKTTDNLDNWLANLDRMKPKLLYLAGSTEDKKVADERKDLFFKLLSDVDGDHGLYAYLPAYDVSTKTTVGKVESDAGKLDYEVLEYRGIQKFNLSFKPTQNRSENGLILFFHVSNDSNFSKFVNLDTILKKQGNEFEAVIEKPMNVKDANFARFGIIDKTSGEQLLEHEININ